MPLNKSDIAVAVLSAPVAPPMAGLPLQTEIKSRIVVTLGNGHNSRRTKCTCAHYSKLCATGQYASVTPVTRIESMRHVKQAHLFLDGDSGQPQTKQSQMPFQLSDGPTWRRYSSVHSHLNRMGNEYRPKCSKVLCLVSKGRHGSFHPWINVWMADNLCDHWLICTIPEHLSDDWYHV